MGARPRGDRSRRLPAGRGPSVRGPGNRCPAEGPGKGYCRSSLSRPGHRDLFHPVHRPRRGRSALPGGPLHRTPPDGNDGRRLPTEGRALGAMLDHVLSVCVVGAGRRTGLVAAGDPAGCADASRVRLRGSPDSTALTERLLRAHLRLDHVGGGQPEDRRDLPDQVFLLGDDLGVREGDAPQPLQQPQFLPAGEMTVQALQRPLWALGVAQRVR
jgi:hypothetical protein